MSENNIFTKEDFKKLLELQAMNELHDMHVRTNKPVYFRIKGKILSGKALNIEIEDVKWSSLEKKAYDLRKEKKSDKEIVQEVGLKIFKSMRKKVQAKIISKYFEKRGIDIFSKKFQKEDMLVFIKEFIDKERMKNLGENKSADLSINFVNSVGMKLSYRINIFMDAKGYSFVARWINDEAFTTKELGIPPSIVATTNMDSGLILVCGPTGSGKTTTLVSLISEINNNKNKHIITIEQPIEFYYPERKSLVTQRELGRDVDSFASGLRDALRQGPDVILVGELRDKESIESALHAAVTGHLVYGTYHAGSVIEVIDGLITRGAKNESEKNQIQSILASVIRAIVVQRLIAYKDEKGNKHYRTAFEILNGEAAVSATIRTGSNLGSLNTYIDMTKKGNISMNTSLANMACDLLISVEEAHEYSNDPKQFKSRLADVLRNRFNGDIKAIKKHEEKMKEVAIQKEKFELQKKKLLEKS